MSVTAEDVERVLDETVERLVRRMDADWDAVSPALGWTCWETVEHISDGLLYYAQQLVPLPDALAGGGYPYDYRERRPGGPEGIMFARHEEGPRGLLRVLRSCGGLLVAALRAAPPGHRAHHTWGRSDPSGFAAMALVELYAHLHDIAEPLGLAWSPDEAVCDRVLARLFPNAPTDTPRAQTLLWATGRGPLPGHAPVGEDWRWHGEVR